MLISGRTNLRKLSTTTAIAVLLALALLMVGCGGGGGGSTPPPTQPVTIQIGGGTTSTTVGQSLTFTATVQNATNTGVSWSVQEGSSGGTVTAGGVYTAPMKAGTYHLVATSSADPSKTATVTITVTAPAPTITSSAPIAANEDDLYTYSLTARDPANTAITFALVSGPSGAQIAGNALTWTPTHAQSRVANTFEVKATTDAGGTVTQKFSITPTGTVRGTAIDTYVTATGEVTAPEDLTKVYIGASVPSGNAWITIEGVTHSDGTFEIHGVPAGNYWLAAAHGGYWTSASDIDLGQDLVGRPDGVLPSSPTFLSLDFVGMSAWDADDAIELFNPNLSQSFNWSDNSNPGDTSTTSVWAWTGPLSDASRGDLWYATQVRTKESGESTWRYLAKATPAIPITQADGSTTELAGGFADAKTQSIHLKTMGSQFAALAPMVGANAQVHSTSMGIYSQPFTSTKGWIGFAQTLLQADSQDPITADTDFGDLAFGNPFPADWGTFASIEYELSVPFTASGATASVEVPAEVYSNSTQLPGVANPFAPVVTPVRNVKLGSNAFTASVGVGTLTPALAWDAPATGAPTGYRVTIYALAKVGTGSSYMPLIDLFTKETGITIPEGILQAGSEYFFAIRSYQVPGVDFSTAPNRTAFPWAHADMMTPVISTSGAPGSNKLQPTALQRVSRGAMDQTPTRSGSLKGRGMKTMPHSTARNVNE